MKELCSIALIYRLLRKTTIFVKSSSNDLIFFFHEILFVNCSADDFLYESQLRIVFTLVVTLISRALLVFLVTRLLR